MRAIPSALQAMLDTGVTTLAHCWILTRRDGSTVYYRLADPRVLEAFRLIQSIAR